jgi:hypothetical protein
MVDTPNNEWERVFELREGAIRSESLRAVYREVVKRLRADAAARPSLGTIELVMVERVAFLYVWVRDREEQGIGREGSVENPTQAPGFVHERTYRETLQMWFDMAAKLQSAFARAQPEVEDVNPADAREAVEAEVAKVVSEVAREMLPEADAKAFTARIAERWDGD